MDLKRCDASGFYSFPNLNGPGVFQEQCQAPSTHRYRAPDMAPGYWSYRCVEHAELLNAAICTIEPLQLGQRKG